MNKGKNGLLFCWEWLRCCSLLSGICCDLADYDQRVCFLASCHSDWSDGSLCGADAANGAGIELSGIWFTARGRIPQALQKVKDIVELFYPMVMRIAIFWHFQRGD